MENARAEVKELQIGMKIRTMRQEKRMTLQALADATGLSKPLLSQIENEQVIPPLATLLRIARVFDVGLHHFFRKRGSQLYFHPGRGKSQHSIRSKSGFEVPPYSYHSLAFGKKGSNFEPFIVEFEQRELSDDLLVSHEGKSSCFCSRGS